MPSTLFYIFNNFSPKFLYSSSFGSLLNSFITSIYRSSGPQIATMIIESVDHDTYSHLKMLSLTSRIDLLIRMLCFSSSRDYRLLHNIFLLHRCLVCSMHETLVHGFRFENAKVLAGRVAHRQVCFRLKLTFLLSNDNSGTNPGLGFRPLPRDADHGSLIWYDVGSRKEIRFWTEILDDFFDGKPCYELVDCVIAIKLFRI